MRASSVLSFLLLAGLSACGPTVGVGGEDAASTGSAEETGSTGSGETSSDGTTVEPAGVTTDSTDGGQQEVTSSDSGSSSSSGGVAQACLGTDPAEALYDDGVEYAVFPDCDGSYFVEKRGQEFASAQEVLDDVFLLGATTAPCCDGSADSCVRVTVQASDFTFEGAVDHLRELFGDYERCFGIQVEPIGFDAPRCAVGDPECLPEPYCEPVLSDMCPDYDPDADRVPVAAEYSTNSACEYDGECVYNALECKSWTDPFAEGSVALDIGIYDAFCGCVDGGCHWFEQP